MHNPVSDERPPAPVTTVVQTVRKPARWWMPVSAAVLTLIVAACVFGPFLSPFDPFALNNDNAFAAPSLTHWLGTDELGRDSFTRLLIGGRLSLMVAAGSVLIALVLGTAWGMIAAVRGGVIDELLMRAADISMAIPQILFALLCVAAFGASLTSLIVITGLLLSPSTARMARASVAQEIRLDYYSAGVAYGAGGLRLMFREILPNAAPGIMGQAVINAASAMILEASLSFVGLGVQPPEMSWGALLQQGYGLIFSTPIYAIAPAVAILLTVLCLNLLADRAGGRALLRSSR